MRRFFCLAPLILLLTSQPMAGEPVAATPNLLKSCYMVKNVAGNVFRWSVTKARWYAIGKGFCIRQGTLVEVTEGAHLEIRSSPHLVAKYGLPAESVVYKFDREMILRMTPDSFRRMQVKRQFVDQSDLQVDRKTKLDHIFVDIKDAWQQTSMFLTRRNKQAGSSVVTDITAAISSKKLQVVYPGSDTMIYRDFYPSRINVMWVDDSPGTRDYQIYLWKKNSQRVEPVAATKGDFYQLPVGSQGSYYIQVTSLDGVYQSIPHLIHVVNRLEMVLSEKTGMPVAKERLDVEKPAENFVMVTQRKQGEIDFSWKIGLAGDEDPATRIDYKLSIQQKDNPAAVIEKELTEAMMAVPLKAGKYVWWVDATLHHPGGIATKLPSPRRDLTIVSTAGSSKDQVLQKILTDKTFNSGVIYLE